MPRRFLAEECRTSRTRARLSAEAECLLDRLITVADDFGIFEADPEVVAAQAFTRRPAWFTGPDHAARLLAELARDDNGDPAPIVLYQFGRVRFGHFRPESWVRFQGGPRARRPKHPTPSPTYADSLHALARSRTQPHADESKPALEINYTRASASASASASESPSGRREGAPADKPPVPTPPAKPTQEPDEAADEAEGRTAETKAAADYLDELCAVARGAYASVYGFPSAVAAGPLRKLVSRLSRVAKADGFGSRKANKAEVGRMVTAFLRDADTRLSEAKHPLLWLGTSLDKYRRPRAPPAAPHPATTTPPAAGGEAT